MKVGFIGLGNMGLPMAENLLKSGNELIVYNRTREKAQPLLEKGARWGDSPADVARQSEVVFTMLADDKVVEEVTLGENGVLGALPEDAIHVSASTIGLKTVTKLAKAHAERNRQFVSSPVLGRPDAAAAAQLRVMVAGPAAAREKIRPLLEAIGNRIFVCGDEAPMANAVKLGNNFLIVSFIESFAEAMTMVRKHGVDPAVYLEVVKSFFGSHVYANYGQIMLDRRWQPAGFKLRLGYKDVKLMLEAGEMVEAPMPVADVIKNRFIEGLARGWGELEWAAILKAVEADAGLDLDRTP